MDPLVEFSGDVRVVDVVPVHQVLQDDVEETCRRGDRENNVKLRESQKKKKSHSIIKQKGFL